MPERTAVTTGHVRPWVGEHFSILNVSALTLPLQAAYARRPCQISRSDLRIGPSALQIKVSMQCSKVVTTCNLLSTVN